MRILAALVSVAFAIVLQSTRLCAETPDAGEQTAARSNAGQKPTNESPQTGAARTNAEQKPTNESPQAGGAQTPGQAPQNGGKQPERQLKQVSDATIDRLEFLKQAGIPGLNLNLVNEAVSVIRQLAASTRANQQSVYLFVRQVNRNLDTLTPARGGFDGRGGAFTNCALPFSEGTSEAHGLSNAVTCKEFKEKVRRITDKLLRSSYTDDLVQNGNLSRQIKLRMPLLIEDSLRLNDNVVPAEAAAAQREAARQAEKREADENAEAAKTKAGKAEPENAEAAKTKAGKSEPENAEAAKTKAGKSEPENAEAAKTKAGKSEPENAEAAKTKAGKSEPENAEAAALRRRDFLNDLELLADRYVNSKRFRLGVGLSYSYIPHVDYTGSTNVDLTPFQATVTNTNTYTGLRYQRIFADASYPGLLVSAKIPFLRLDTTFSNLSRTQTFSTPVRSYTLDPSTDVLKRDTVSSKLRLVGDVSLKAQLVEALRKLSKQPPLWTTRFDLGVGGGLSGFRVDDSVSSEVKAVVQGTSFNGLPPGTIIKSSSDTSFRTFYWDTDFSLKISDEFQMALEAKFYNSKASDMKSITVSGATFSISAVWFPTFF